MSFYYRIFSYLLSAVLIASPIHAWSSYGTWLYGGDLTVEEHLDKIAKHKSRDLMWLYEYLWDVEELRQKDPLDPKIEEKLKEVKRLSQCYFENLVKNIAEYVDPARMPKNLAWELGKILVLYGTAGAENPLPFYKNALAYFSYSLGLSESAPPLLHHADLSEITSTPEVEVDEEKWLEEMDKLEQQRLDHLCLFFRTLHYHPLVAKAMLAAQKKAHFNLDAVHPWIFRSYLDLKESALRAEVEKQCLKLLPPQFSLEDLTAENEFAVCEAVRRRNLLPKKRGDDELGKKLVDEFEFSPNAMRQTFIYTLYFFDEKTRYATGLHFQIKSLYYITEHIYNYLSGFAEVSDLDITEENALEYLKYIKVFDLLTELWNSHHHVEYGYPDWVQVGFIGFDEFSFPRSTYELRKHILKLCPRLGSYEALTVSVHPEKISDEKDDLTPEGWIEESEAKRQEIIEETLDRAWSLSNLMNSPESPLQGVIVGARGVSGAGKSTFLKRHILSLLPESDPRGILNPDTVAAALKKFHGEPLNTQVHEESLHAFMQIFQEISKSGSFILDRRLLSPHSITINLIEPAREKGSSVWLFDLDVPLEASLVRILARPLEGDESYPDCEVLVDGFVNARKYRRQVVDLVLREETLARYELYASGAQKLVAHKTDGQWRIEDPELFEETLRVPAYEEIEAILSRVIDAEFIEEALAQRWITPEQRELLEERQGLTLKESLGGSFEAFAPSPFQGEEWLADLPHLIRFLEQEHLLHLQGVDETGAGLHWSAHELRSSLNPRFEPKSHIQMKLGYFIVPMENLDLYLSENLSPEVARELIVRDDDGKVFGLRFFVHPEAYSHFAPLLEAKIAFVPPSESEFMGSPTSSYNCWLVRNIEISGRIPFLAKMGTPRGSSDIRHLLSGDEIVRSLTYQKHFDKLPENENLLLFKETAGLVLKSIPSYPLGTVDSGVIITEIPQSFLDGECALVKLTALFSCEKPPLIFDLIEASGQTPQEFLETTFVERYFEAIEPLYFQEGFSVPGDNLYGVLNSDNTLKGFAYRDLGKMRLKKTFLDSFTWNYRYCVVIKLLNVLTESETEVTEPPRGAPIKAGTEKTEPERNLHFLWPERPSITFDESDELLKKLDDSYLSLLQKYFSTALDTLPAAEKGSTAAKQFPGMNEELFKTKIPKDANVRE